ncbi:5'/3'-nucleotidase SurE [Arvimicrobium flavum]|uniref:5'/3'-nucleotidase SurE n=1 Tax=Arvimicrobium flavum TaxID=3393320 RepID=UPI00237BADD6|nr:5'/3'-nucleotidase SurE [Mesorhizobium shangrilense]
MRILLTNDDGVHDEGIASLERIARQLTDDVWIVAPETDQSGFAHSLSISQPLRLRKVRDRHFAVRGTPTDCVIMAVKNVMPSPPDLILSGVNSGSNVADDVTYSGTVAGAMEGTLLGIRSIALSQAYNYEDGARIIPYETAEAHAPRLIDRIARMELPQGVLVNLNFPKCRPDEVREAVVTDQGKLAYGIWVDERADGRGFPYYWLRFGRKPADLAEGTDIAVLQNNCISVTPLKLDFTAHEVKAGLAKAIA